MNEKFSIFRRQKGESNGYDITSMKNFFFCIFQRISTAFQEARTHSKIIFSDDWPLQIITYICRCWTWSTWKKETSIVPSIRMHVWNFDCLAHIRTLCYYYWFYFTYVLGRITFNEVCVLYAEYMVLSQYKFTWLENCQYYWMELGTKKIKADEVKWNNNAKWY